MKTPHRFSYIALVFLSSALLIRTIYYGVSVLWVERYRYAPWEQGKGHRHAAGAVVQQNEEEVFQGNVQHDGDDELQMRRPTPEEIVHAPNLHIFENVNVSTGVVDEHFLGLVRRRALQEYLRSFLDCVSTAALR